MGPSHSHIIYGYFLRLELRASDILDLYDTIINYGYNMQDIIHGPPGTIKCIYVCIYL